MREPNCNQEDTAVSNSEAVAPRFKTTLTWGGIIVAFLGMVLMGMGGFAVGLLLVCAGMMSWLFAKRRTRVAESS